MLNSQMSKCEVVEWSVGGYYFLFHPPIFVFRRLKTDILLWQQCLAATTTATEKNCHTQNQYSNYY